VIEERQQRHCRACNRYKTRAQIAVLQRARTGECEWSVNGV
jgi:hypothetical protein